MKITVNVRQEQYALFMENGEQSILSLLQNNKIYIDAPCNGNGTCGKCKALITGQVSSVTPAEKKLLSEDELGKGIRLTCKTYPIGDCVVSIINNDNMGVKSSGTIEELFDLSPVHTDNVQNRDNAYGLAVDIGTTTVASYFYNLKTGEKMQTVSGLNEQRSFGADVISRINSCIVDPNGLALLQKTIVDELNEFIGKFASEGHDRKDIVDVTIAANTVMLHLFAGLSPNGIAVAPFTPTSLFGFNVKAIDIGLDINEDAQIYLTDCISGYVGGDITAGMLSSSIYDNEKNVVYIDIGTNGEMAVGNKDGFVCCATAAGPAFEGAHIKHGVGGINGAISKVYIEDNDIKFETINNDKSIGICGSGLIDAISVMVKLGVIDETGRIDEDEIKEHLMYRYFEDEDGIESFYIDIENKIAITQKDVREIQLAKSAIAAGIKTMLNAKKIGFDAIERLVLAGGFGSFINKQSACEIGLLPIELLERIEVVGNAAGMGAIVLLLSEKSRDTIKEIYNNSSYYELSGDPFFQDQYIEEMCF